MSGALGGLRHLFTAVSATAGRRGGFQTIAYSRELGKLLEAVEELVSGYQPGDSQSPGCRQLLPVPGRGGAIYALTSLTPLGKMPDQRPGNYWAETVVVPRAWLDRADWDAAAAFGALEWLGPGESAKRSGELPAEELPDLAAGPLDRLGALMELVPEEQLRPLIQLVAQQAGLGLQPLRILEAPGVDPKQLEAVVTLLPLLLPPPMRLVREGETRRCLTLRTRSPQGGMGGPGADFTGFSAAAYEVLEQERGVVISLGGQFPPPKIANSAGAPYAAWLALVLREGRWQELEAVYREEIDGSPQAWFATFRGGRPAAAVGSSGGAASGRSSSSSDSVAPPPPLGADDEPVRRPPAEEGSPEQLSIDEGLLAGAEEPSPGGLSTFGEQQAAWIAREQVEGRLWQEAERYREEIEKELGALRDEMARAVEKAKEGLKQELEKERERLAEQKKEALKGIESAALAGRKQLEQDGKEFQRKAAFSAGAGAGAGTSGRHDAKVRQLEAQVVALHEAIASGDVEQVEELKTRLTSVEELEAAAAAEHREPGPEEPKANRWKQIVEWNKQSSGRYARIAGVVGLLAVVALLAWSLVGGRLWPAGPPPEGSDGDDTGPTKAERLATLVPKLQRGEVATRLLSRVAASPELAARGHRLALAMSLGRTLSPDDRLRCVLLQTVLRRRAADRGEDLIAVDGDCGTGTERALLAATSETCCADLPSGAAQVTAELKACALGEYLQLSDACTGASPWAGDRDWTPDEAARFVELIGTASSAVSEESGLALDLGKLDPETGVIATGLAEEELSPADAAQLLDLAFALAIDMPEAKVPENPPDRQLERLEALVAQLTPETEDDPGSQDGGADQGVDGQGETGADDAGRDAGESGQSSSDGGAGG